MPGKRPPKAEAPKQAVDAELIEPEEERDEDEELAAQSPDAESLASEPPPELALPDEEAAEDEEPARAIEPVRRGGGGRWGADRSPRAIRCSVTSTRSAATRCSRARRSTRWRSSTPRK